MILCIDAIAMLILDESACVCTDTTMSYITVFTDDVINNNNNEKAFPEPTRVFKEEFEITVQEGIVL